MYILNDFGNKLKNLRVYRNIKSQRQAAMLINKHHQQWYLWESGQTCPAAQQLIEICNVFKISIEYFYKEGLPENYDFSGNTIKQNLIPFVETTISRELTRIIKEALQEKCIILVEVFQGAGTSRAIEEYAAFEKDILIFDGKKEIDSMPRSGLNVVILDHAEYKEDDEIRDFIKRIMILTSGIVIVSHKKCNIAVFTKKYKLNYLSIEDIKKITNNALPELMELLNQNELSDLKPQILCILACEIIDNINKIIKLKKKFQEDVIPQFSLENIVRKLSRL